LPADLKRRGRTSKIGLKDALRPWIPDRILDRPKMGFSVPLSEWFRGRLRELPTAVLLDPRSLDRGLFREDAVRGLIEAHMGGTADNARKLWSLLQLELWLRSYIDPAMPVRPTVPAAAPR
jgi:asparagine synthase (glutamine-hydrolysing)